MNSITEISNRFFESLESVRTKLEAFAQTIKDKDTNIEKLLSEFCENSKNSVNDQKKSTKISEVDKALAEATSNIFDTITTWSEKLKQSKKGKEFMKQHEKYLATLIFGAVKAGKSSLGNLMMGKGWLDSPIDNAYKNNPHPIIEQQESARQDGSIEVINGQEWFKQGYVDCTGTIQYFTLSGLRWFDSPGTGALSKAEDTRNMEEMVNEYLKYVDMCIFLINSSEPGLQSDFKYMERLQNNGLSSESIVVITKSDTKEEDFDDDGNIISVLKPKDVKTRSLQENDMCKRLKESYPSIDPNHYKALSISTELAEKALQTGDEKLFQDSNIDKFMNLFINKANTNIVELKLSRPKKFFNQFIDEIIDSNETTNGNEKVRSIKTLKKVLNTVISKIDDFKTSIQERTKSITNNVIYKAKLEIEAKLSDLATQIKKNESKVTSKDLATLIRNITQPIMLNTIKSEISKILDANIELNKNLLTSSPSLNVKGAELGVRKDKVTSTYVVTEVEERDPEGFWEHICFWKSYYTTVEREETKTEEFVVGTNLEEVIDNIIPTVTDYVRDTVRLNLESISTKYYLPQEEYVKKIINNLNAFSENLKKLRF